MNVEFEPLMNVLRGNVGLIFTNGDLRSMRNDVTSFRVPAAAKAGIIAPRFFCFDKRRDFFAHRCFVLQ